MAQSCYIHIPFCKSICSYCDFYSVIHDPELEGQFAQALMREIELRMAILDEHPVELKTLYFGGGTPTVLSELSWRQIFAALRSHFVLTCDAEITVEANPESATLEKLTLLRQLGVNRLSLGAQSFHSDSLRRLRRIHTAAQIRTAVDLGRKVGFANISLDLMYGLPDETDDSLHADLEAAISLKPEHVSLYALTLEGDVLLRHQVERRVVTLPDDDQVARRYIDAVAHLAERGYGQYEISNFAVGGYECRHNLAYWTPQDYYAFGPAAVSTLSGIRTRNDPEVHRYIRHLLQGKLPPCDVESITPQKRLLETIMLSLRLKQGLSVDQLLQLCSYDILRQRNGLLRELQTNGDLVIADGRIRLTPQGMFRSDMIASSLCPDFV